MKRYELANGAAVNVIETDRFKSSLLSINLAVPIEAETAALNTLLFCVLKQGSANYPSQAAINTRLDDLYAAELSTRNYKRGDMQILGFAVDFLDNCYIPDGTDVLGGSADMLGELLLHPLLDESGCFRADLVAREKTMLCDAIRAQINNKRAYAQRRCIEEMCRGERFALPLTGTVEEVDAITPKMLTDRYYALLRTARVEFFFIGSTPTDVLLPRLEHAFAAYPAHSVAEVQTQVVRRAELVREITEEQDVAQGKLVMGFRSGYAVADPDYLHFMVFCELFGVEPKNMTVTLDLSDEYKEYKKTKNSVIDFETGHEAGYYKMSELRFGTDEQQNALRKANGRVVFDFPWSQLDTHMEKLFYVIIDRINFLLSRK